MEWTRDLGFGAISVGIEMRAPRKGAIPEATAAPLPDLITDQFDSIGMAAEGCDIILGANAHQYAARSIAEARGIPYFNALYSPTALPADDNSRTWNERSLGRVNANRVRLGLAPVDDVLRHIVTARPLLAIDPKLASGSSGSDFAGIVTGAWFLDDVSPLPEKVSDFLAAGEPPVYFGFGSMPVAPEVSHTLIEAARASGHRVILSEGWAELDLDVPASDCMQVREVNHLALFPKVSAVVHHGEAGTTHAAARVGTPQVVVSMFSDQPFWGSQVRDLGIGVTIPMAELTADLLAVALDEVKNPIVKERAGSLATDITVDGVKVALRYLLDQAK